MPSPAIIATQLTDRSSRAYTLTVNGFDVLGAFAGAPYVTDIESISITEKGPPDVSTMSWRTWDPNNTLSLPEMGIVECWDVTNSLPLFAGFIQEASPTPAAVGRFVEVTCVGNAAMLDWMLVPSLTIPSGTAVDAATQSILANATGIGVPLRATADGTGNGTQANPVGNLGTGKHPTGATTSTDLTLAGETVREALRKMLDLGESGGGAAGPIYGDGNVYGTVTVDPWWGLRLYALNGVPGGYTALTVKDAPTGSEVAATSISHSDNGLSVPRGVYVKGATGAASGLIPDGSGIPGPVAYIEDSSITTAALRDSAGVAYLERQAVTSVSGSLTVDGFAPTTNIRPGSNVAITSTQLGLTAQSYTIASITKSFYATKQTWRVEYGRLRQRATRQLRHYTRAIRS